MRLNKNVIQYNKENSVPHLDKISRPTLSVSWRGRRSCPLCTRLNCLRRSTPALFCGGDIVLFESCWLSSYSCCSICKKSKHACMYVNRSVGRHASEGRKEEMEIGRKEERMERMKEGRKD